MELVEAVRTRRSAGVLLDEAPGDDEMRELVSLAMNSPDHAGLRPWRLVLLRGEARSRLGAAMAREQAERDPDAAAKAASKPLRAPLLVSVVFRPVEHPKVHEWEQLAATAAMATTLLLLLHDRGWNGMWRTGAFVDSQPVRDMLGLAKQERLLGWLYVGRHDPQTRRGGRPSPDAGPHISTLCQ